MTEEQLDKMGFREWTAHYEKEQEADRDKINTLAEGLATVNQNVGRLTANVETLIDNQKGMFNRINRPMQWGIFATFAGVIFLVVGLVVTEIKENIDHIQTQQTTDIERNLQLHMWFRDKLEANSIEAARHNVDIEWIKKLEDRLNNRIHTGLGQ